MKAPARRNDGREMLRRTWRIEKPAKNQDKQDKEYVPSYKRPGFDESKVIKL
jgi:hypothetical protein